MTLKTTFFKVLLLSIFIVVLAACSNEGVPSSKSSDGSTVKEDTDAVKLVITSSGGLDVPVFEQNILQYLERQFPHFEFQYIEKISGESTIDLLLTTNQQIDLIFETIGGLPGGLMEPGLAMDISDLVKSHDVDLNRFEPSLIDGMRGLADGGLFGLPVMNLVMVTYYNKELFDAFGVKYPEDGLTWDEAMSLAAQMTRNEQGVQYLGLASSEVHTIRMNQFSLPYIDPETNKTTFDQPGWKRLIETIYIGEAEPAGYKEYMQGTGKFPYKDEFLKHKNLSMLVYFNDLHTANPSMADMDWDMATVPVFSDMPGVGSQPYPTYWNITSISEHPDEAMQVIKYLVSDEYQTLKSKQGEMTTLVNEKVREVYGEEYEKSTGKTINWDAAFKTTPAAIPNKTLYDGAAESALKSVLFPVSAGEIDINTALRQAKEQADTEVAAAMESK